MRDGRFNINFPARRFWTRQRRDGNSSRPIRLVSLRPSFVIQPERDMLLNAKHRPNILSNPAPGPGPGEGASDEYRRRRFPSHTHCSQHDTYHLRKTETAWYQPIPSSPRHHIVSYRTRGTISHGVTPPWGDTYFLLCKNAISPAGAFRLLHTVKATNISHLNISAESLFCRCKGEALPGSDSTLQFCIIPYHTFIYMLSAPVVHRSSDSIFGIPFAAYPYHTYAYRRRMSGTVTHTPKLRGKHRSKSLFPIENEPFKKLNQGKDQQYSPRPLNTEQPHRHWMPLDNSRLFTCLAGNQSPALNSYGGFARKPALLRSLTRPPSRFSGALAIPKFRETKTPIWITELA